jgi:hypothetical protein
VRYWIRIVFLGVAAVFVTLAFVVVSLGTVHDLLRSSGG